MRDETLDDYLERNNLFLCRELTDEEIKQVWFALEHELGSHIKHGFAFARAILRKAQE